MNGGDLVADPHIHPEAEEEALRLFVQMAEPGRRRDAARHASDDERGNGELRECQTPGGELP